MIHVSIEMHFVQAMTPWPGLIHGFHEGRNIFFLKKGTYRRNINDMFKNLFCYQPVDSNMLMASTSIEVSMRG